MQIVIDIPDNMDLRNYDIPYDILNIVTSGTPLDKIKSEIEKYIDKVNFGSQFDIGLNLALYIIDKHINKNK